MKDKKIFTKETYEKIYPSGSKPAFIYGTPKMHKLKHNTINDLSLRPIISSIGTYNYNLAKFLSSIGTYNYNLAKFLSSIGTYNYNLAKFLSSIGTYN